jgi:hypothetical protein
MAQVIRIVTPSEPLFAPISKGIGKNSGNFILPLVQEQPISLNKEPFGIAAAKYSHLFVQMESTQAKKGTTGVFIPLVWDSRKNLTGILYRPEAR